MRDPTVELSDRWAVRITVCGNAETVCDGYLTEYTNDDGYAAANAEAEKETD